MRGRQFLEIRSYCFHSIRLFCCSWQRFASASRRVQVSLVSLSHFCCCCLEQMLQPIWSRSKVSYLNLFLLIACTLIEWRTGASVWALDYSHPHDAIFVVLQQMQVHLKLCQISALWWILNRLSNLRISWLLDFTFLNIAYIFLE